MWPLPQESEGGLYEENYFSAYSRRAMQMPAGSERPPDRYVFRLKRAQALVGIGKLLEVGPGTGAFLKFASEAGWDVCGIETSQYACEMMNTRLGLDVRCGTLRTVPLPPEEFHVVHMSHVLEHLSDPLAALKTVHRVLKPGGHVIIEVPNEFNCIQFRVLHAAGLLRPYAVPSTHVFFFTPGSLNHVLKRAGFSQIHLASLRDMEGGSAIRRWIREVAFAVERPFGVAPLIEAFAVK